MPNLIRRSALPARTISKREFLTPFDEIFNTLVGDMFPTLHLRFSDIISSWAGLRPLIHEKGKLPSEISRRDEIFVAKKALEAYFINSAALLDVLRYLLFFLIIGLLN